MKQYIDKNKIMAEIEKRKRINVLTNEGAFKEDINILSFLDTLESVDPYEQRVQYDSIKAGIQTHAETYSFNIESELFHQLTKEQQALWRKEIERACISGGEVGVELARDPRYKENLEGKKDIMTFAEVIEGLKNGQNFTRINSPLLNGKFITMQIPADIPTDVIPKMASLNDGAKAILGTVGDCQIHYRNQILMVNKVDGEENVATYYIPTWEDIFADDWISV